MVQLYVNVVQPPVVQLWFQVVPRALGVVQVFTPEAEWWCGGGVVGEGQPMQGCLGWHGSLVVVVISLFKKSSETEEAPRQNLLTLLKQFWSKKAIMPKYDMIILLYGLLSKTWGDG